MHRGRLVGFFSFPKRGTPAALVGAEALLARAWAQAPFWTREKREFCAPLRGAEGGCRRMPGLAALGRLSRRTCPRFLPSQQSVVGDQSPPAPGDSLSLSNTSGFSLVFNPLGHLNPRSPPKEDQGGDTQTVQASRLVGPTALGLQGVLVGTHGPSPPAAAQSWSSSRGLSCVEKSTHTTHSGARLCGGER